MSPQEFKAWFEGFSENMDSAPTQKQWKKIQEKIKLIDNAPVQIVKEYRPYWYPTWFTTVAPGTIYNSHTEYRVREGINTVTCDSNQIQPSLLCENSLIENAREIGREEARLEYVERCRG
jgi:hypothetical protein